MSSNNQKAFGKNIKQEITNIYLDTKFISTALSMPNNQNDLNRIVFSIFDKMNSQSDDFEIRPLHPSIDDKLEYNNVVKFRYLIEENYCENAYYLDNIYQTLDSDSPGKKKAFLKFLRNFYLEVLGDFLKENKGKSKLDVIREKSDEIISALMAELFKRVSLNNKKLEDMSFEEISIAIFAIVSHAFVDCKVLENPNK